MSWWRWSLFRRKAVPTLQVHSNLVRDVVITVPDWHEDEPDEGMRKWHSPRGAVLSLAAVARAAIPPPARVDLLRRSFRRLAEARSAGLVEADLVQSPYGPSAQMVYKALRDRAFVFTGMLLLPADAEWLVCTVVDCERGTTGVREAVVTAQLIEAGALDVESYEERWANDPYDSQYRSTAKVPLRYLSDDESYDAQFPDHPLSIVRCTLRALLENVFINARTNGLIHPAASAARHQE